jgi:hypothetical protein
MISIISRDAPEWRTEPHSGKTSHMSRMSRRAFGRLAAGLGVAIVSCDAPLSPTVPRVPPVSLSVIPFSATEIINPGRGMYNWLGVLDYPIGPYSSWPGQMDYYLRCDWSAIQTGPHTYNWAYLDDRIAAAAANRQRFGLRVMPFNPWTTQSMPSFLWNTSACTAYSYRGSTWYEPNYNDTENYLPYATQFIAALGARYDLDERLAWFEFSLYGDWGEGDIYQSVVDLGVYAPDEADSISVLGYWAEGYQSITLASVTQLVNAHLAAFPNTQLLSTNDSANYAICKQLLTASTIKPVGLRQDGLTETPSFYGTTAPLWALDPKSYYVRIGDPFLATVMNRWQIAPIATEQGGYSDYDAAVSNVCNYCVSLVASQNPGGTTDSFATAIKYSGYRYAVTAVSIPAFVATNSSLPITATWTNFGVAPTYDRWQITYQLRNSSNVVVATADSSLNLKTLFNPSQANTTVGQGNPSSINHGPPLGASTNDTASISTAGLAAGTYTVAVVVTWAEHKAGATHTWNYGPMNLALQDGQNSDGSYPIGTVAVRRRL